MQVNFRWHKWKDGGKRKKNEEKGGPKCKCCPKKCKFVFSSEFYFLQIHISSLCLPGMYTISPILNQIRWLKFELRVGWRKKMSEKMRREREREQNKSSKWVHKLCNSCLSTHPSLNFTIWQNENQVYRWTGLTWLNLKWNAILLSASFFGPFGWVYKVWVTFALDQVCQCFKAKDEG